MKCFGRLFSRKKSNSFICEKCKNDCISDAIDDEQQQEFICEKCECYAIHNEQIEQDQISNCSQLTTSSTITNNNPFTLTVISPTGAGITLVIEKIFTLTQLKFKAIQKFTEQSDVLMYFDDKKIAQICRLYRLVKSHSNSDKDHLEINENDELEALGVENFGISTF